MGVSQNGGFLQRPWSFPTKHDQHLGCEMGIPPFKETPISFRCLNITTVRYIKPTSQGAPGFPEGWRPSSMRHKSNLALVVNVWRIYSIHQNLSKERRGVLHMITLTFLNQVHVCFNCSFLLKWSNRCCWTTCCLPRLQKQWCTYLSNISCFHLLHQEIIPKNVNAFSTFIKWPQFLSGLQ